MRNPTNDPAPSYDDIFHDHPENHLIPAEKATAYTPTDDIELHAHSHVPHPPPLHCERCSAQSAARDPHSIPKSCCAIVAVMLSMMFFCAMMLGAGWILFTVVAGKSSVGVGQEAYRRVHPAVLD